MSRPDYARAELLVDEILKSFNALLNDRDRDHVIGICARTIGGELASLRADLAESRQDTRRMQALADVSAQRVELLENVLLGRDEDAVHVLAVSLERYSPGLGALADQFLQMVGKGVGVDDEKEAT